MLSNRVEGQLLNGASIGLNQFSGHSGEEGDRGLFLGGGGSETMKVTAMTKLNEAAADDKLTISFWQFLNSIEAAHAFYGQDPSAGASQRGLSAHTPWPDGSFYFDTSGGRVSQSHPNPQSYVNQWAHFALVKDGPKQQIWINGGLYHEETGMGPLTTEFRNLWIGSDIDGVRSTEGRIDDFALFGMPLGSGAIGQLANHVRADALYDEDQNLVANPTEGTADVKSLLEIVGFSDDPVYYYVVVSGNYNGNV